MGTQKTQLFKRDLYGLLVATEQVAQMLGDYERAREGAYQVRVEETTQPVWDDIVVYRTGGSDRWQVKRQLTPLDEDEARKILAAAAPFVTSSSPIRLRLGCAQLVAVGTRKQPVFELKKLGELCDAARAPVDPVSFEQAHKNDPAFKFLVASLPPTASAVATLKNLYVHELGTEEVVRARAVAHLNELFTNADEVVTHLQNWLVQHSDGLIQIDSNVLHAEVIDRYAKHAVGRGRWVHLCRGGTSRWEARGPIALDQLVGSAWEELSNVRVQVGSQPFTGEQAVGPIARLLLHRAAGALAESAHGAAWRGTASKLAGETLGLTSGGLPLSCGPGPAAHPHPPRSDLTTAEFARELANSMDDYVWAALLNGVPAAIHAARCAADVRSAILSIWERWLLQLTTREQRAALCCSMLATAEESMRVGLEPELRSGPLLVNELAQSMVIALALGVGFEAAGHNVDVRPERVRNLLIASRAAHLIAVPIASHPRDRQPCRFEDDPVEMLAPETGMTILAGVGASALDLYGIAREAAAPFHATDASSSSLKHRGLPEPLLTASAHLRQAMRHSVEAVRQHVVGQLQQMAKDRSTQLRDAVAGASTNG